ncbi:MAG TPA: hypothetical protein V6D33_08070, partial [Cyanophyceae cyanobacterium]
VGVLSARFLLKSKVFLQNIKTINLQPDGDISGLKSYFGLLNINFYNREKDFCRKIEVLQ